MFYNLINKIKICKKTYKKILISNKNKNDLLLLKTLIKLNIIKFIKIINNKYYIHINYLKNKKTLFNMRNLYKSSHIRYINLKNLKKFKKKNKIIILSSNKGILNNFEALNKKLGGIALIYLWN